MAATEILKSSHVKAMGNTIKHWHEKNLLDDPEKFPQMQKVVSLFLDKFEATRKFFLNDPIMYVWFMKYAWSVAQEAADVLYKKDPAKSVYYVDEVCGESSDNYIQHHVVIKEAEKQGQDAVDALLERLDETWDEWSQDVFPNPRLARR